MSSSVFRLLEEAVGTRSDFVALSYPVNGVFQEMRWQQVYERVVSISSALLSLDVKPLDRVAIMSKTRVEWTLIDLAILGVSACTVPLYPSINDEDYFFILNDSQASVLFVENIDLLFRLREFRARLPHLKHVILIEGNNILEELHGEMRFSQFLSLSKGRDDAAIMSARMNEIAPDSLASIVYTSGTTGEPKGAMITHDNFLYEAHAIEKLGLISSSDIQLIFLPLAHIFARVLQFAWLKTGHVLVFAEEMDRLAENIRVIRPTVLAGVPRVFEKIHARIMEQGLNSPGFKKRLVRWAFDKAEAQRKREMAGEKESSFSWALSEMLVFSKIKSKLEEIFGGRLRFLISGGAPLSPEITYFFKFSGVMILEGWGLSETTAATCLNIPTSNRIGTVGKALPGTDIKIDKEGEILVKGRGVFKGYWNKKDATQEAFDNEGYFRTGDIGVLQPGDFLKITDRKKDLIVTAGGKKVAPQRIEGLYKSSSPLISQVVAVGDAKPYLVGLFTLDEPAVKSFAKEHDLKGSFASLTKNTLLHAAIQEKINEVNAHLASFEQIKRFAILDRDFQVGEELTPTLKVKRKYCSDKYQSVLEKLYAQ